ncbi:hypothetical protein WBG78_04600 [Chryseolinea sp. T2]|uniref:tetratricopeptide repeat protein n=1 Tax=Chryseolinea sp. T2 TaxID=3129255 RepID=UPI00307836BA
MSHQSEQLVEEVHHLASARDWKGIIDVVGPFAVIEPGNHWFQSMTGMGYYYTQDFEKAVQHLGAALEIHNDCPMGLWLMGNLLRDHGDRQSAVGIWESVACQDPADEKFGKSCPCMWESLGRTLVADSKLMLAVTYDELGYKELSKRYRNSYLKAMSDGVKSLVDKEKVREWLLSKEKG